MNTSFSKWPGAWERHLIRRHESPQYFEVAERPTATDIASAQLHDQQELTRFHSALENLIERCTGLSEKSSVDSITAVKLELDACHDTAFGLATDLTDQKNAIASLNEIITATLQQALNDKDETTRMQLMQSESVRMQQLHRLEYPIVCDLLRSVSPIPNGEVTGALLSESDTAYRVALEILDNNRKAYLAQRIDIIISDLNSNSHKVQALNKLEILQRQLPGTPAKETAKAKELPV